MNNSEVEHKWFHWANYLTMLRGVVVHFLNNSLPTSHWIYISNGTFSFKTRHNWMDQIFSNYVVNDKINRCWCCCSYCLQTFIKYLECWMAMLFAGQREVHLVTFYSKRWPNYFPYIKLCAGENLTEISPFMPGMILLLTTLFNNFIVSNSSCQSNCKSWKEALDTNITHISQFDFSIISFEGYKMSAWRGKANWESS